MGNTDPKLLKHICYIISGVAVVVSILSLCLTKSPDNVKCRVTNASLTNSSLSLEITMRNPNNYYRVRHDRIDIDVIYKNRTLGSLKRPSFSQGHDLQTRLTPSFGGLILGNDDLCRSSNNCEDKLYDIIVTLYMEDEYKKEIVPKKRYRRYLQYTCELKVPDGTRSIFNTTRCPYLPVSPRID